MDFHTKYTFLTALLTVLFANSGVAIKCFDCNSVNNSMCLDPSLYDKETIQKYKLQRDCSSGNVVGHKEFFCRKMTQTILKHGLEAEVRITRGCGWVKHHRECYKADNDDHLEIVCQCFKDQCNSANVQRLSMLSLCLAISSVIGIGKKCLSYI